jgi:hypothetical protein
MKDNKTLLYYIGSVYTSTFTLAGSTTMVYNSIVHTTDIYGIISDAPTTSTTYLYKLTLPSLVKWAKTMNHMSWINNLDVSSSDSFLILADHTTSKASFIKINTLDGAITTSKRYTEFSDIKKNIKITSDETYFFASGK